MMMLSRLLVFLFVFRYNDAAFTYQSHNLTQIVPGNSFIYMTDLAANVVIGSNCNNWLNPKGSYVLANMKGVFLLANDPSNDLRFNDPSNDCSTTCLNGVYSCVKDNNETQLLGVYKENYSEMLTSSMTIKHSVSDYFPPLMSLELDCISSNYPPTFVSWFRNNNTLDNITDYTKILIDAPTSKYISRAILSNYTNISGKYFCEVNSTSLSSYLISSSTPIVVSGSPAFTVLRLLNDSAIYIEWEHNDSTGQYDHVIVYKDITNDEVYYADCGIVQYCNVANLSIDHSYLFVIAPTDDPANFFQPTEPKVINISEPNIVTLSPKEADQFNDRSLDIVWHPFIIETTVTITYIGSCGSNTTCSNATLGGFNKTNATLSNLVPGISYTLLIWGENAIGKGSINSVTVKQNETARPSSPLGLFVNGVTFSSINITWNHQLSCCNFSGEDPTYNLSLSTNDTDIVNDIVYEEDIYYCFDNLEPSTEYDITISAINSAGIGWNETISVLTEDNSTSSDTTSTVPTVDPTTNDPPTVLTTYIVIGIASLIILITAGMLVCCIVIVFVSRSKKVKNNPNRNYLPHEQFELTDNTAHNNIEYLDKKYEAPYLIEFPTDTKAIIGETVRFLVHIKGYPEPSLSWEYQGEPVSPVGPIQIFSDGTFVILDVQPQYSGRYTFAASNPAGVITRVINLKVIDEDDEENENEIENEKIKECRSVVMEHKPIPVEILEKYVETHHGSDNDPFQFLFTSLRAYKYPTDIAADNKQRNRYRNIIPYDSNTVPLLPLEGWTNFQHAYINASYIDGYNAPNKFIATQAPIAETVTDFWRMVHQKKCHIIVALCNLHEGNRVKCEQYWPASINEPEEHGPYIVRLLSEELYSNFTVRSMEILLSDGSQDSAYVKQYHYTSWPDHGVPENGSPLVLFHQKIMTQYRGTIGEPIIVHCSAGIGRSGTFIALDIALEQIRTEGMLDIVGIINHMREQRMKMVQTCIQLMFLHDIILEYTLCGSTLIPIVKLSESLELLYTENKQTTRNGFQTQFQLIQRLTPKLNKYKCSIAEEYIDKNRPNVPLPSDSRRVILYNHSNDYINASYIDGFQQKKAFIVTQNPLQQTITDFWQMIIQHECSIILMLCQLTENSKVVCSRYWPLDTTEAQIFDCYSIKLIKETYVTENMIRRTLGIKNMNTGHRQTVTQIQFSNWLPDGQCVNHQAIGELHTEVMNAQRITGAANNPIVIHCSDCVTRSGMYCATHIAIDQARLEQVIDVFQTVKNIRMQRPGSVPNEANYITIHDFVRAYLTVFDIYQVQLVS